MKKERLFFVDWLRCLIILTLIPYHASLTYTGLGEIYIKNPVSGKDIIPFIFTTMPLDNFFMTLLFFVSGIGAYYSLKSKDNSQFLKERTKKLLIPFLLGTILLCPIQAFSMALYKGTADSFIDFIPLFFSSEIVEYLGYAHLWFLLYLSVFTAICLPVFRYLLNKPSVLSKITAWTLKSYHILYPILWIIVGEALLRPFYPGMQILILDWANDLVYLSVFIMGFFYASEPKIHGILESLFKPFLFMTIFSFTVLFFVYYYWLVIGGISFTIIRIWALLKGIYEVSLINTLMVLGKRHFDVNNRILEYLRKSSFFYYLFHMVVVTYLTLFVVNLNINIYVKFLLTVSISYLIIALFYKAAALLK